MNKEYLKQFISKVYKQAPDDFIERYKPDIDFTALSSNEKLYTIMETVKTLDKQDFEWFEYWYLI